MFSCLQILEAFLWFVLITLLNVDRKSGSAGMPRPISYAVFCLKKKKYTPRPGMQRWNRPSIPSGLPRLTQYFNDLPLRDSHLQRLDVSCYSSSIFFYNGTTPTQIYTLSLHDALPILGNNRQD